ncbi:MAG: GTPase ObgE [Deltaproteobacteria bacterium]|nr:GTPase ObgE [Deltaproteobacteria bacterium]
MRFVDEVSIRVQSGAGGNGCVSFRREKFVPKGGPNGGNGGRGGSVFFVATHDKTSLLDFRFRPIFKAQRGSHGRGSDCDGKAGEDLVVQVPPGTLISDCASGELIADLVEVNIPTLVAKGGRGGRGNKSFVSSTRQAPKFAQKGEPGQTRELKLELRLIADVGLIGLPNAGKSSLLRKISKARPKVADYAFTTLVPHLGVAHHKGVSFIIADLPGLIEGASTGLGLGLRFLRHVTRSRLLLHLVDISTPLEKLPSNIQVIRNELRAFDPELLEREEFIVFTKADLLPSKELKHRMLALKKNGFSGFAVSSHSALGINELLDATIEQLKRRKKELGTALNPTAEMAGE